MKDDKIPPVTQEPIMHIDSTPDNNYPLRVLRAYRENCNVTYSTDISGDAGGSLSLVCKTMNDDQRKRAKILDKAIEALEKARNQEVNDQTESKDWLARSRRARKSWLRENRGAAMIKANGKIDFFDEAIILFTNVDNLQDRRTQEIRCWLDAIARKLESVGGMCWEEIPATDPVLEIYHRGGFHKGEGINEFIEFVERKVELVLGKAQ